MNEKTSQSIAQPDAKPSTQPITQPEASPGEVSHQSEKIKKAVKLPGYGKAFSLVSEDGIVLSENDAIEAVAKAFESLLEVKSSLTDVIQRHIDRNKHFTLRISPQKISPKNITAVPVFNDMSHPEMQFELTARIHILGYQLRI